MLNLLNAPKMSHVAAGHGVARLPSNFAVRGLGGLITSASSGYEHSRSFARTATAIAGYQGAQAQRSVAALPIQTISQADAVINQVGLTGHLAQDIVVEQTTGGAMAKLIIAVSPRASSEPDYYHVELRPSDADAEALAASFKAGMHVHVKGRMRLDSWTDPPSGRQMQRPVVEGDHIFFVDASPSARAAPAARAAIPPRGAPPRFEAPSQAAAAPQQAAAPSAAPRAFGGAGGAPASGGPKSFSDVRRDWDDCLNNPQTWWDNRLKKSNPKSPDFKHKTDGRALWVDSRSTPPDVLDLLQQQAQH